MQWHLKGIKSSWGRKRLALNRLAKLASRRLEKACGLKWNANSPLAFYSESFSERIMYPWPIGDFDYAIDVALDTAMNHLERAGQAEKFRRGPARGGNCDCNSLENG